MVKSHAFCSLDTESDSVLTLDFSTPERFSNQLKMNRDKLFFRYVLLYYFDLKKAEPHHLLFEVYGEEAPSERTCRVWYERFRNGDFDVRDKERPGHPKKLNWKCWAARIARSESSSTLLELSKALNVTPVVISKRLHAMGKIHKEGIWLSELSKDAILNRLSVVTSLLVRQRKKSFLWRLVTGGEKWIYFDNLKRRKSCVDLSQSSTLTPRRNIHEHKTLLCIWWDQEGVLYYELSRPNETVTADH